jgi:hypothetical protein
MTTTVKPGNWGRLLTLRATGRAVRETIAELPEGEQIVLDWTGVEVITGAFGDDLCGVMFAQAVSEVRAGRMPRWFIHVNYCPEVAETLCLVAARRIARIRQDAIAEAEQAAMGVLAEQREQDRAAWAEY